MAVLFMPMKLGDNGADVKKAQVLLAKAGSTIKPNGVFTIGMRSAVVAYQKKNNLKVTGIIDKKTWEKLNTKPGCRKTAVKKTAKK